MTDTVVDTQHLATSSTTVPTAAFFVDPRATDFLLKETVLSLIAEYSLAHAYVDVSSPAGLAIAEALVTAGVPFQKLEYGDEGQTINAVPEVDPVEQLVGSASQRDFEEGFDYKSDTVQTLHAQAMGVHRVALDKLADIDANLVLVPTVLAGGFADFSPTTVLGTAFAQINQRKRDMLVIGPPEHGLRRAHVSGDGAVRYERHIIMSSESLPDEEHSEGI